MFSFVFSYCVNWMHVLIVDRHGGCWRIRLVFWCTCNDQCTLASYFGRRYIICIQFMPINSFMRVFVGASLLSVCWVDLIRRWTHWTPLNGNYRSPIELTIQSQFRVICFPNHFSTYKYFKVFFLYIRLNAYIWAICLNIAFVF